jgi:hypothetical protein
MTRFLPKLAVGATALFLAVSVAQAQTPQAPPAATPKAAEPAAKAATPPKSGQKKASTPEGIECSAQADAKNLHGKERKTFRTKCIRDLKKASATKSAPAAAKAPAAPAAPATK